jgi:sec-independent protein translocase protein TatA
MIEGLLQPSHLLLILVVALFVFGPKKLPELGKGLAQGIRGFKDAIKFRECSTTSDEKSLRS